MSSRVRIRNNGVALRGAALIFVAGLSAGCSGQVARFGGSGIDNIYTAGTPTQQQILPPRDTQSAGSMAGSAPAVYAPDYGAAQVQGGSDVGRGALAPVTASPLPGAQPAVASRSVQMAAAPAMASPGRISSAAPANAGLLAQPASASMARPSDTAKVATASGKSDRVPPRQDKPQNLAVLPQQPKPKQDAAAQKPATAAMSGQQGAGGTHVVKQGDTLSRIARANGVSVDALKAANGMQDGLIRVGQTLKIPGGNMPGASTVAASKPVVQQASVTAPAKPASGAGEKSPASTYTPPRQAEKLIEQDTASAPNATGIDRMRWPVRGRVITQFGNSGGRASDGIDIAVPEGTPVKAAENGVVIYAGDGLKEFGNTVLVRHEDGLVTVYGHASNVKVTRGEKVKRGQEIALSGMTGNADSPRLHFEVRKNSAPVDPVSFLE